MLIRINNEQYIAASSITKIEVVVDVNIKFIRIYVGEKRYDIDEERPEYVVMMKFIEQNTFTGIIQTNYYTDSSRQIEQLESRVEELTQCVVYDETKLRKFHGEQ